MSNTGLRFFEQFTKIGFVDQLISKFYSEYTGEFGLITNIKRDRENLTVSYRKVHPQDKSDISTEVYTDSFQDYFISQLERNKKIVKSRLFESIEDNPSDLENISKVRKIQVQDITKQLKSDNFDEYRKRVTEGLEDILNTIEMLTENREREEADFNLLIEDFAEIFSENATYEARVIEGYLLKYYESLGTGTERAKAKSIFEEESIPSDSTLDNWEKKFRNFVVARTRFS